MSIFYGKEVIIDEEVLNPEFGISPKITLRYALSRYSG
jgi:hypothetical protein